MTKLDQDGKNTVIMKISPLQEVKKSLSWFNATFSLTDSQWEALRLSEDYEIIKEAADRLDESARRYLASDGEDRLEWDFSHGEWHQAWVNALERVTGSARTPNDEQALP